MRLVNVSRREANGRRDVTVKATGLFRLESLDLRDDNSPIPSEKPPTCQTGKVGLWTSCRAVRDTLVGLMIVSGLDPKPLEQDGLIAVLTHLERDPVQRAEILGRQPGGHATSAQTTPRIGCANPDPKPPGRRQLFRELTLYLWVMKIQSSWPVLAMATALGLWACGGNHASESEDAGATPKVFGGPTGTTDPARA